MMANKIIDMGNNTYQIKGVALCTNYCSNRRLMHLHISIPEAVYDVTLVKVREKDKNVKQLKRK